MGPHSSNNSIGNQIINHFIQLIIRQNFDYFSNFWEKWSTFEERKEQPKEKKAITLKEVVEIGDEHLKCWAAKSIFQISRLGNCIYSIDKLWQIVGKITKSGQFSTLYIYIEFLTPLFTNSLKIPKWCMSYCLTIFDYFLYILFINVDRLWN